MWKKFFGLIRKPFKSNITAVFVGWTNIQQSNPFLYAKWQELFCLIVTDSTETLTDVLEKGT